jgi:hypothetical protein
MIQVGPVARTACRYGIFKLSFHIERLAVPDANNTVIAKRMSLRKEVGAVDAVVDTDELVASTAGRYAALWVTDH